MRTKNATFDGDIAGLLTEMQILAWEIAGLEAPGNLRLKRAGKDAQTTVAVWTLKAAVYTMQEAQTLTDRFTTSLSSTEKVILVERGTMNDVLEEQGFTAGECASDECAAEVGAMLGVEFMISGAIGKLGNAYTIDAKMFSVATGAAESMKSITYSGAVEGLIVEIEILAWDILGLDPPRSLKKTKSECSLTTQLLPPNEKEQGWGDVSLDCGTRVWTDLQRRKLSGFGFMLMEAGLLGMAAKSNSDYTSFQTSTIRSLQTTKQQRCR